MLTTTIRSSFWHGKQSVWRAIGITLVRWAYTNIAYRHRAVHIQARAASDGKPTADSTTPFSRKLPLPCYVAWDAATLRMLSIADHLARPAAYQIQHLGLQDGLDLPSWGCPATNVFLLGMVGIQSSEHDPHDEDIPTHPVNGWARHKPRRRWRVGDI